jgi:hypothetical protein
MTAHAFPADPTLYSRPARRLRGPGGRAAVRWHSSASCSTAPECSCPSSRPLCGFSSSCS